MWVYFGKAPNLKLTDAEKHVENVEEFKKSP